MLRRFGGAALVDTVFVQPPEGHTGELYYFSTLPA